jgi:2-polyprenyl-3-methyl-5-hydroxy-6-metoxy-1,4-benzoquinol methylase
MTEKFARAEMCPVCSSPRLRSHKKGTFDYALLKKDQIKITDSEYGKVWDLSECQDCGHIFADPCPRPEFIFSLYSQVEDPVYDEEAEGRSRNFLRILASLEKLLPARGRLFDVGAATGILLRLARERGWSAEGIEASEWAVAFAAENYAIRLNQGFFEEAPLAPCSYQAVTMVDFIEHTPTPREAVAKANKILAPGGILCLVTPDIHSRAARLAGMRWWHLRPGHLAYFSLPSLRKLLSEAGFEIVKRKKYAWTFSAYYVLSRIKTFGILTKNLHAASFLKRIQLKLALGDSFEIYAKKSPGS